jgi:hypothetical protein
MPESEGSPETSEEAQDTHEEQRTVSRQAVQIPGEGLSRWIPLAALLVAVVAVGLSIWALTSSSSDSSATANLPGDPKTRVCTAFNEVSKAVQLQTNSDVGPDPVAKMAVAGNARLALLGGGQYLLTRLGGDAPSDLADPVRSFANDLQEIGMAALTGSVNTDPEQAQRMTRAEVSRKQIVDMCK